VTQNTSRPNAMEDPLLLWPRILTKAKSVWLRATYPFAAFESGISVHHSCEISRKKAEFISLGKNVYLAQDVWLNVIVEVGDVPKITLERGCKIGRRTTISSRNRIVLEEHVMTAPSVLIMDHNHEYSDVDAPISEQGVNAGGTITIGKNCWLGYGSVIFCSQGEVVLGQNCVVGANAVVTKSFPAFSVIAGNPATIVKRYDPGLQQWIRSKP
jgi:acetyltransferase-like isoleucine patch superfamily enzyme